MLRYAWICLNILKVHLSREAPGGFWEASGGLLRDTYLRVLKYVLKVHFFVSGGSGKLLGGFWEAPGKLLGSFWVASGWLLGSFWETLASKRSEPQIRIYS